ncbi:alanine racemase [Desulfovibrio inopinatus]|uniref:alanine racemase n=1 Tax=Desulfovibrio inopinatus TaxID=102109 RepID=UPI0003F4E0E6|nr:alanine racemase [Desulfovibrio inopinatus]
MTIPYNYVTVSVHLDRIIRNYNRFAQNGPVIPVIKADAYGHGLFQVAAVLDAAGAEIFAVGSVEEAVSLRDVYPQKRILSLLGPILASDYDLVCQHDILCFIHHFEQIAKLGEAARAKERKRPVDVALKWNTGMNRLGFRPSEAPAVINAVREAGLQPVMVSSHLACADDPNAAETVKEQAAAFTVALHALRHAGFPVVGNLANSAAALAYPEFAFDHRRVGIALYGGNPFWRTSHETLGQDLECAMEVATRIASVHPLRAGESINYGYTFTAKTDMTVAIVAAGYADAYPRSVSGKAWMVWNGKRVPVLGRVCMQLSAVDVTGLDGVSPGQKIMLLGGGGKAAISADELASWWGTISYEVMCLLGLNPRVYAE